MRKAIAMLVLLALVVPSIAASAGDTEPEAVSAGALDVTVTPETPKPDEEITASFPAPEGAVNATLQACVGDKCFIPARMERQGDVFRHTFYINETGEAHLNIAVKHRDGSVTYDNATAFQVKKRGGGSAMPGFTVGAAVAAVAALAVLYSRTKS